jgi:hypothetical protein
MGKHYPEFLYKFLQTTMKYTVRSKVLGLFFFKKNDDTRGRDITFFIQNNLNWHIYLYIQDFCSCTFSEKLPKFPFLDLL